MEVFRNMPKVDDNQKGRAKQEVYQRELEKLTAIFADVETGKQQLVAGLIEDASFLRAESHFLRQGMAETGMIKIHPQHKDIQKPVESGRQYLKVVNSYAVVIKTLNGILQKNTIEQDDEFDDFISEMRGDV
jgi:regulator of replication initiation timing